MDIGISDEELDAAANRIVAKVSHLTVLQALGVFGAAVEVLFRHIPAEARMPMLERWQEVLTEAVERH